MRRKLPWVPALVVTFFILVASGVLGSTAVQMSLLAPGALAGTEMGDTFSVRASLARQVVLVEAIQPYVERMDLPRLLFLKQAVKKTLESLSTRGLGHIETLQRFQELVISYRFSKDLFAQIRTGKTGPMLEELVRLSQGVAKSTGFDQSLSTQITASTFTQIHWLMTRLDDLPLQEGFKAKVRAMSAPIGKLVAISKKGDDAVTFQEAREVLRQVRELYPDFNNVVASNAAFYIVLEIQGLAEFYAEFSGMDRLDRAGAL